MARVLARDVSVNQHRFGFFWRRARRFALAEVHHETWHVVAVVAHVNGAIQAGVVGGRFEVDNAHCPYIGGPDTTFGKSLPESLTSEIIKALEEVVASSAQTFSLLISRLECCCHVEAAPRDAAVDTRGMPGFRQL